MYKIANKRLLAPNIYLMDVEAPRVAKSCYPGQFVIVKMDERGECVSLTICDYDAARGTVTIVFQTLGDFTKRMAEYEEGQSFSDGGDAVTGAATVILAMGADKKAAKAIDEYLGGNDYVSYCE